MLTELIGRAIQADREREIRERLRTRALLEQASDGDRPSDPKADRAVRTTTRRQASPRAEPEATT